MRIMSINPGYSVKEVEKHCGFELLKRSKVVETSPPTYEELRILREEVDPYQYVIGR